MFNIDRRYMNIILIIFVVIGVIQYAQNPSQLLVLVLTLPGVLVAITFHEFAHAWMADKLGDNTPREQGRLTLNPLAHLDPFGVVMLVFAHFGWGKPVEIDPRNFNRDKSMSAQEAMVAIAGPVMNILLAIIFVIISSLIAKFAPTFIATTMGYIIMIILEMTVEVNIGLGIFNLIPLPPLDGSKVLMHFLSYNAKNWFLERQNIFYVVFLIIWITGLAGTIIAPIITGVSNGMYWLIATKIFGIKIM